MSSAPKPGIAPRLDRTKFQCLHKQLKATINKADKERVKITLKSISSQDDLIEIVTTEIYGLNLIKWANDEFMRALNARVAAEAQIIVEKPKQSNGSKMKVGKKAPKIDDSVQAFEDAKQRADDISVIVWYLLNAANGKCPVEVDS